MSTISITFFSHLILSLCNSMLNIMQELKEFKHVGKQTGLCFQEDFLSEQDLEQISGGFRGAAEDLRCLEEEKISINS